MARRVHIEHPETGVRLAIDPGDFEKAKDAEGKTYAERGFEIVAWEDGEAYEAPKPAAKKAEEAG